MKGDFSRISFDKKKNYSGVLKQQGRVSLDADWNEQVSIATHHIRTRTRDTVGISGANIYDGGFEIRHPGNGLGKNLLISTGRIYVEGILCELYPSSKIPILEFLPNKQVEIEEPKIEGIKLERNQWVLIATKETPKGIIAKVEKIKKNILILNADVSSLDKQTAPSLCSMLVYSQEELEGALRHHLVYLDVWERHITAIEDSEIREKALGGPDTTSRTKTIADIKSFSFPKNLSYSKAIQELSEKCSPSGGRLDTLTVAVTEAEDPCLISEGGGYRGLENRLYRVEIHQSGNRGQATFKWSRDNGSVVFSVEEFVDDKNIKLKYLGKDQVLALRVEDWVEISDDISELKGEPGTIAQIKEVDEAQRIITFNTPVKDYSEEAHAKVRRWDQDTEPIQVTKKTVDLENGIQVRFSGDKFKTGDYWVFMARTATGEVEKLECEPPMGTEHYYCPLALVTWEKKDEKWRPVIKDCRPVFPSITELASLFYVSGDGQEGIPGEMLSKPLQVGVTKGCWPVANAEIKFKITEDDDKGRLKAGNKGTLLNISDSDREISIKTDSDGLAECRWQLGEKPNSKQVKAILLDDAQRAIHLPVCFNANLSAAGQVYYDPADCVNLQDAHTVQDAIDALSRVRSLYYVSGDGQEALPDSLQKKEYLPIPLPLRVGVASKCGPAKDASVQFEIMEPGGGRLQGKFKAVKIETLSTGIASCSWEIDNKTPIQHVKATLLDASGNKIHLPIIFTAYPSSISLFYVSGDGQEAISDPKKPQEFIQLDLPLKVGVANGRFPVESGIVRFKIDRGDGRLEGSDKIVKIITKEDGTASCRWEVDTKTQIQQVEATLLDATSNPIHLPILFTAYHTTSIHLINAETLDGARRDTDGTLSGNNNDSIPTEKAVKTYVDNTSKALRTYVDNRVPAGSIVAWLSETLPVGWLECSGARISRKFYSRLFSAIGTMYGRGDGSTTFEIPDLRGYFLRGWSHGLSRDPDRSSRTNRGDGTTGDHVGTIQPYQIQSHAHITAPLITHHTPPHPGFNSGGLWAPTSHTNITKSYGGNETRPRNINVMFIIKY